MLTGFIYQKKKEEDEDCIGSEENNLGRYVKNSVEKLLEGIKLIGAIDVDSCVDKDEYKKRRMEEMEKGWKEKVMHGQFLREMGMELINGKRRGG